MSAKACVIYLAALIGVAALARPPAHSIDVTLEEGLPQQPLLTPEAIASFREWMSKEFPAKLKAARLRGEAAAKHDIKAHHFRLRECGKPAGTRGIDPATGYELE